MLTTEVIEYFHTQVAVAAALRISQASVAGWGKYPPPMRQIQLQRKTRGRLKAEPFERLVEKASEIGRASTTDKAQTATE